MPRQADAAERALLESACPSAPVALPRALRKTRKPGPSLPPPAHSVSLLVRLSAKHTGMFRFLLEAYDNLAFFTVLEHKTALLRFIFSPHREREARAALDQIAQSLSLTVEEWPFPPLDTNDRKQKHSDAAL